MRVHLLWLGLVVATAALALYLLRDALVAPDCGFHCPPGSGSASNAPGP